MQHLNRGMILDRLAQLSKENSTQLTPLKAEPGTQLAGTPFCQSNSVAPQPIASQIYRPQSFILEVVRVPRGGFRNRSCNEAQISQIQDARNLDMTLSSARSHPEMCRLGCGHTS
jgi:hypothetical protein